MCRQTWRLFSDPSRQRFQASTACIHTYSSPHGGHLTQPASPYTMFAPAFGRAVRSTCASAGSTAASTPRSSLSVAAASTPFRRIHHRRPSSSKASCPPDGSQPPASAGQPTDKITEKIVKGAANAVKKSSSRSSKRKAAAPQSNVPYVPPTDHLAEKGKYYGSYR